MIGPTRGAGPVYLPSGLQPRWRRQASEDTETSPLVLRCAGRLEPFRLCAPRARSSEAPHRQHEGAACLFERMAVPLFIPRAWPCLGGPESGLGLDNRPVGLLDCTLAWLHQPGRAGPDRSSNDAGWNPVGH